MACMGEYSPKWAYEVVPRGLARITPLEFLRPPGHVWHSAVRALKE